jgi:L-2-hydroxyglutarate oxidase LhgO
MEVARRHPGRRLLVLEKEERVAAHQSGRNSGVIHSGIYYKPGSLKARTCVEGAAAMLAFCREEGIRHAICGKVVVAASEEEIPRLEEIFRRGTANGVAGIEMIGPERLREIEPHCRGVRAVHVPSAAITDYAAVTRRFASIVTQRGGSVRTGARVTGLRRKGDEIVVETTAGAFRARGAVNCAGLHSDRIAGMAGAEVGAIIAPFRGEYYVLREESRGLVGGLIYPVPDPQFPFLGVHFTRRVDGSVEAGPNAVLACRREGYRRTDVHLGELAGTLLFPGFWRMSRRYWRIGLHEIRRSLSRGRFLRDLQRLLPGLRDEDLAPGGSGVRAQLLDRSGTLVDDFRIVATDGMVHVLNVPSPAATASLVIGRRIADMLDAS